MNTRAGIKLGYLISCFFGTIGAIFLLFDQYFSNEDTSVVSVKKFSETKTNSLPAITLCFTSDSSDLSGLYDERHIWSTTGLTAYQYQNMMMGNQPYSSYLDKLTFEMATIKLQHYLTRFKIKDSNNRHIFEWNTEDSLDFINFFRHYQDPTVICYSYHTDFVPNISLESVNFYFSIYMLQTIKDGELHMFVHHNNQLIRNMRYLSKVEQFEGINYKYSNNKLVLDLNSISIIRSRKDANEPCNQELENDDAEWMQHVVQRIGCFPPYWRRMYSNISKNNFNECNTTQQLKNMSRYLPYENENVTKSILKLYDPPCDTMRVLANSNVARTKNRKLLKIKFRFRLLQNIARLRLNYMCVRSSKTISVSRNGISNTKIIILHKYSYMCMI